MPTSSNQSMPEFDQLVGRVIFGICGFILIIVGWRGSAVEDHVIEKWAFDKIIAQAPPSVRRINVGQVRAVRESHHTNRIYSENRDEQTALNQLHRLLVVQCRSASYMLMLMAIAGSLSILLVPKHHQLAPLMITALLAGGSASFVTAGNGELMIGSNTVATVFWLVLCGALAFGLKRASVFVPPSAFQEVSAANISGDLTTFDRQSSKPSVATDSAVELGIVWLSIAACMVVLAWYLNHTSVQSNPDASVMPFVIPLIAGMIGGGTSWLLVRLPFSETFESFGKLVRALLGTAIAVFPFLFAANLMYHDAIRDWMGIVPPQFIRSKPTNLPLEVLILLCIGPAIVEELWFRWIILDSLRRNRPLHASVWITAILFAALHIGHPLSFPYLIFAGAVFGYVRTLSGSIILAVIAHMAHNALIFLVV